MATHFGSFPLADDGFEEPLAQLNSNLTELGPTVAANFIALAEGGWRMVD